MLHWDRRREAAGTFQPSSRLIEEASRRAPRSVLHVWEPAKLADSRSYTISADFDWALLHADSRATDFRSIGSSWGSLCGPGAVNGPRHRPDARVTDGLFLQADVKFTELVAEIVSSVLRLNRFERQKSGLRQFFALRSCPPWETTSTPPCSSRVASAT